MRYIDMNLTIDIIVMRKFKTFLILFMYLPTYINKSFTVLPTLCRFIRIIISIIGFAHNNATTHIVARGWANARPYYLYSLYSIPTYDDVAHRILLYRQFMEVYEAFEYICCW